VSDVDEVVRSIREGKLAVLPTDTVYGLVCAAFERQPALDLYRLKGRDAIQPTAVLFASVSAALALLPGHAARVAAILEALLPGPYTLIVPNPQRQFAWLSGTRPESIGVRVPVLTGAAAEIVGRLGAVVATSANLPGEPDPRRLADVPSVILDGVVAAIDAGELPGVPSTVIDLSAHDPVVVRVGAGDAAAALNRIAAERQRPLQ
jgi:L-threonylcarbamoyladenylate synthase